MKKWTKGSKGCVRFAGCGGFWVLGVRARWRKEDCVRELRKPAVTGFQMW